MDKVINGRYRLFRSHWQGGYTAYGIHDTMLERFMWKDSQAERDAALEYLLSLRSDELWTGIAERLGWTLEEGAPAREYESLPPIPGPALGKHSILLELSDG